MEGALRQRLALFSILLIVGVVAGASIVALGAEKAIPGTSNDYVSVVKAPPPPPGLTPEQQSELQARYEARLNSLVAIANKDKRAQQLLAEPQAEIIGIALPRGPGAEDTGALLLKVDSTFYKITIDMTRETVISLEQRVCYGPGCNS
ncbi:MAG: hypothetical protein ACXVI0_10050 [Halobacteriota archaeon]